MFWNIKRKGSTVETDCQKFQPQNKTKELFCAVNLLERKLKFRTHLFTNLETGEFTLWF